MIPQIVQIADVSEDGRAVLAPLVRSVLPEYYELLCPDATEADAIIAKQMSMVSELNTGFAALEEDGTPIGVVCCYPVSEQEMRQTAAFLRTVPPARRAASITALRQHAQAIAPLGDGGIYIARLVVAPSWRARGVGRQLLSSVEEFAGEGVHDRITLHLHRANTGARDFYESCGFHALPGGAETFPAMQKNLTMAPIRKPLSHS